MKKRSPEEIEKEAMHDLKIKDEDAWAVADRYVQDNLDVLSIW